MAGRATNRGSVKGDLNCRIQQCSNIISVRLIGKHPTVAFMLVLFDEISSNKFIQLDGEYNSYGVSSHISRLVYAALLVRNFEDEIFIRRGDCYDPDLNYVFIG